MTQAVTSYSSGVNLFATPHLCLTLTERLSQPPAQGLSRWPVAWRLGHQCSLDLIHLAQLLLQLLQYLFRES